MHKFKVRYVRHYFNTYELAFLFLCFLSGVLFFSTFFYIAITIICVLNYEIHKIERNDYIVIIYVISHIIFGRIISNYNYLFLLKCCILPLAFYLSIKYRSKNIRFFALKYGYICISLGVGISSFISVLEYNARQRYTIEMLNTGIYINPVNLNMINVIGVSLFFYAFYVENNMWTKIVSIVSCCISIFITFRTAKWTNIVVIIIVMCAGLFISRGREIFKILIWGACVAFCIYIFSINIQNFAIVKRQSVWSGGDSLGVRIVMWKLYIPYLLKKPFSGNTIYNPYYEWAHNIFLDVYIRSGIITAILLVALFVSHFKKIVFIINHAYIELGEKIFWISIALGIFGTLFIEPGYEASPQLMILEFGIIACCNVLSKEVDKTHLKINGSCNEK